MTLHIRTTRFTKDNILADLEDLYRRALTTDQLTVAFKIKEAQAKILGFLKNKTPPEPTFQFEEASEDFLQQIYDEARRVLKEKTPTSPLVPEASLPSDAPDTPPKRDSNAPVYW